MASRREPDEEPVAGRPSRLTVLADGVDRDPFADVGYRLHTLYLIRTFDIREHHNFWGSSTPMKVRRELIAEAWLGPAGKRGELG